MKKTATVTRATNAAGSILIGSIALCILMAIAGIGFLQITTSGINGETAALKDLTALVAGESGLNYGLRYLRDTNALCFSNAHTYPFGGSSSSYQTINGMDVQVVITDKDALNDSICANVFYDPSGGHAMTGATFMKRVGYIAGQQSYTSYATLFGSVWKNNPDFKDLGGAGTPFRGFTGGMSFYGRFHMNCFIEINGLGSGIFTGPVTVANNPNAALNHSYAGYGIGPRNKNDYTNGLECEPGNQSLWGDDGTVTNTRLDQVFTGSYKANQPMVTLPQGGDYANWKSKSGTLSLVLPQSWAQSDTVAFTFKHYHPTLQFTATSAGNGKVIYYYRKPSNKKDTSITYLESQYNGKVICSDSSLNVLGKVEGAVTVATDTGTNIYLVDTLVYRDAKDTTIDGYATKTVPSTSTNILGLVPGKQLVFDSAWKAPWKTSLADSTQKILNDDGADTVLHVTAAILAVENANDVNGRQGTEFYVNNCDDTKSNYNIPYVFRLYGNHVLAASREFKTSGGFGAKSWGGFTSNYDPRFATMSPPGYPSVYSYGLFLITVKKWIEQNVY